MYRIISNDQVILGVAHGKSIDKQDVDLGVCSLHLTLVMLEAPLMAGQVNFTVGRVLPDHFLVVNIDERILFEGCRVAAWQKASWKDSTVVIEGLTVFYDRKKPASKV